MNNIRLFSADSTDFAGLGIGILADILTCTIDQELNSSYEMTFTYPITGIFADQIDTDAIVVVPSMDQDQDPQAFRIYGQTKPINGIVTYKCQHISYDMADIPVLPFSVPVPRDATDSTKPARDYLTLEECISQTIPGDITNYGLNAAAYVSDESPFKNNIVVHDDAEITNKEKTTEAFKLDKPSTLRNMLGGSGMTILGLFPKAEFVFDNFKTHIYAKGINRDNNFAIVYGKNLVDLSQEKKISSLYTHIYPYWVNTQTTENGDSTSGLDRYRTSILWTCGKNLAAQKNSASIGAKQKNVTELPVNGSTNTIYNLITEAGGEVKRFIYNAADKKYEDLNKTYEKTEEISGAPNSADFVDLGSVPLLPIPNASITRKTTAPKILLVDLTSSCGEVSASTTTEDIQKALKTAADKYLQDNLESLTVPEISLKVTYAQLSKTMGADYMQEYDRVRVGDIVHVYMPQLNVDTASKCTKVSYDVLTNRVTAIEIGTAVKTLTTTIANQEIKSGETPTLAETKQEISENVVSSFMATKRLIDSNRGGFVQFHNSASQSANPDDNQGTPDEILILDAESGGNIEKAKGVWRWNSAGLGYFRSTTENPLYVYQPFETEIEDSYGNKTKGQVMQWMFNEDAKVGVALTANGEIDASLIKVGKIEGVEANFGEGRLGVSKDNTGNWSVTLGDVWAIDHGTTSLYNTKYSYLQNKYFGGNMNMSVSTDGDGLRSPPTSNTRGMYILDVAAEEETTPDWKKAFGAKLAVRGQTAYFYTDGQNTDNRYAHYVVSGDPKSCIKIGSGYDNISHMDTGDDSNKVWAISNCCDVRINAWNDAYGATPGSNVSVQFGAFNALDMQELNDGFRKSNPLPDSFLNQIGINKSLPISIISNGPQVGYNTTSGTYFVRGNYAAIWFNYGDAGPNAVCKGRWAFDTSPSGVSDRRTKNNIIGLSDDFDEFFDNLKPVRFSYNNDPDKTHVGYIAQDVEESAQKNLPAEYSDAFYKAPGGGLVHYSLYYNDFIALNTYEIQKLKKRVAELETLLTNKL